MPKKICVSPQVAALFARADRLGLSTLALEKLSGVHHDVMGKWRRGQTTPNMTTFAKIDAAITKAESERKRPRRRAPAAAG